MDTHTKTFLTGLAILAVAGLSGTAAGISVDGSLNDWVADPSQIYAAVDPGASAFNPLAGIAAWVEDGTVGASGPVGPGYGGQNFDLEAMYAYFDEDGADAGLYIAIVTGFDQVGVRGWPLGGGTYSAFYRPGDIFLDIGGTGTWDLAIETAGLMTGQQPEAYGGSVGQAYTYVNPGSSWYTLALAPYTNTQVPSEVIHNSNPAVSQELAIPDADIDFVYWDATTEDNPITVGDPHATGDQADMNALDHNVMELYISWEWLQTYYDFGDDPVDITIATSWTEQCGNDLGEVTFAATDVHYTPDVPEPLSMVMLGCFGGGMLAMRRLRRKTTA